MINRTRIFNDPPAPLVVEHAGERVAVDACAPVAEIGNVLAGITDIVLRTPAARYLWLTVVSDDPVRDERRIGRGWYVVREINEVDAVRIRRSWAVLRPQPGGGGG